MCMYIYICVYTYIHIYIHNIHIVFHNVALSEVSHTQKNKYYMNNQISRDKKIEQR